MKDLEQQLVIAAFVKMMNGELLSITDAQRVLGVFIDRPPRIDTQNQGQAQQLMAQAKAGLERVYFGQG